MQKLEKLVQKLRTLISLDENCPVHFLFKFKIVKNLIECLTDNYDPFPTLQNETLWILINVFTSATGDMLDVFRSADFPALLMRLLNRESNLFIAENVLSSDAATLVSLELPSGRDRKPWVFPRVRHNRQRLLSHSVHQELSGVLQHHLDGSVDHFHHLRAAEDFGRVSHSSSPP